MSYQTEVNITNLKNKFQYFLVKYLIIFHYIGSNFVMQGIQYYI